MNNEGLCLLVKTPDSRHFFTEIGNFPQLIEFGKGQQAEISVVKPKEKVDILELPDLAKSLCDPNWKILDAKYDVVELKLPSVLMGTKTRQKMIAQAQEIRKFIEDSLVAGNVVSLQDLADKFRTYSLSEAAIRKHMTHVRLKLAKVNKVVSKIGVGTYKIQD